MTKEFDFIDWVRRQQRATDTILLPAGDDLAILRGEGMMLIGIDQVLDGVHFDLARHAPHEIGLKAMNRNLSDCAAMACLPAAAVVSFALPRGIAEETVKAIYQGIQQAGERFDCPIVGGDTGAWDQKLAVSVAILARAAGVTPVRRDGAKPGEHIYVTGPLGGSILGRHLMFTPRIHEARELATRYRVGAMIDLSDGLSRDLAHICRESGVGALIDGDAVPIHADVSRLPPDALSALDHALSDGEDYELCFTSRDIVDGAIRVGEIIADTGVWLRQGGKLQPLRSGAFEHRF
ncbi:MAG TPA: thiamine-phosphate kinase [Tepidisphaeraceae bacterium]|jgi:thiamine-monophosphate kinase